MPHMLRPLFALALLSGCASATAQPAVQAIPTPAASAATAGVDHVVIVWLNDANRNDAGRAALMSGADMLRTIPGLVSLSVGRAVPSDRPIVDDSFDVAFHFKFASVADMQAYVAHPTHIAFLKRYTTDTVARILVYDSQ